MLRNDVVFTSYIIYPRLPLKLTHAHVYDDDNSPELNDRVRSIFGRSGACAYTHTHTHHPYTRNPFSSVEQTILAKTTVAATRPRVFKLSRSIHSRQWQTELRLIFLVVPSALPAWLLTINPVYTYIQYNIICTPPLRCSDTARPPTIGL